ncbi:uncharacterized protein BJ171DRAFT_41979 [Polychytrium aggregatum]|uniref:uncharacterized protein n=1 Tax=Polychytrium aggregatum TaxID=110093 RepID=UPI0022FF4307|nr:uncharacterized protein BJ171DRAFT_41979 [Polychytrium aggregatum]KAI9206151.1 hypothetical protein BJ171DRAFT_41979 [Polychytrium aggregatum]
MPEVLRLPQPAISVGVCPTPSVIDRNPRHCNSSHQFRCQQTPPACEQRQPPPSAAQAPSSTLARCSDRSPDWPRRLDTLAQDHPAAPRPRPPSSVSLGSLSRKSSGRCLGSAREMRPTARDFPDQAPKCQPSAKTQQPINVAAGTLDTTNRSPLLLSAQHERALRGRRRHRVVQRIGPPAGSRPRSSRQNDSGRPYKARPGSSSPSLPIQPRSNSLICQLFNRSSFAQHARSRTRYLHLLQLLQLPVRRRQVQLRQVSSPTSQSIRLPKVGRRVLLVHFGPPVHLVCSFLIRHCDFRRIPKQSHHHTSKCRCFDREDISNLQ